MYKHIILKKVCEHLSRLSFVFQFILQSIWIIIHLIFSKELIICNNNVNNGHWAMKAAVYSLCRVQETISPQWRNYRKYRQAGRYTKYYPQWRNYREYRQAGRYTKYYPQWRDYREYWQAGRCTKYYPQWRNYSPSQRKS